MFIGLFVISTVSSGESVAWELVFIMIGDGRVFPWERQSKGRLLRMIGDGKVFLKGQLLIMGGVGMYLLSIQPQLSVSFCLPMHCFASLMLSYMLMSNCIVSFLSGSLI